MFNDFNLTDAEILFLIQKFEPLITKESKIKYRFDEDLNQEIKLHIFKVLTKNRKKFKNFSENSDKR